MAEVRRDRRQFLSGVKAPFRSRVHAAARKYSERWFCLFHVISIGGSRTHLQLVRQVHGARCWLGRGARM